MKRILAGVSALLIMTAALCGCADSSGSSASSQAAGSSAVAFTPTDDTIKVDQLEITTAPAVVEGYDFVGVSFVNNTDFEIVGITVGYKFKDDVTADQVSEAFPEPLKNSYVDVDDVMSAQKNAAIETPTQPGGTSVTMPIYVYGHYCVTEASQLDMLEPTSLEIFYLADGINLYWESYSYETGAYGLSPTVIDTTEWGTSVAANALPRCDAGLQISASEYEDLGSFYAEYTDVSQEEFESYVEKCKNAGYTSDASSYDTSYRASDADGKYQVSASYTPYTKRLSISIKTL